MEMFEVALVGAGPIGLELAVALKRRGVDYVHLEARQIGHTMTWWAPQTRFFSSNERIAIAGVPLITPDGGKATREQYLAYLRTVVELHRLSVRTYEPVVRLRQLSGGGFELTTAFRRGERLYRTRKVVLAVGGTERPHRLGVVGEDLPHVSHYLGEPHQYFGRRVLIVGGKNSAAEAALRLYHAGATVLLSYRRAELPKSSIKYWLYPELSGLIQTGAIEAFFETTVGEISDDGVTLLRPDGRRLTVAADFVLLLTGYEADMRLFREAGVTLQGPREVPVYDAATMETDVRGLYVAGTAAAGTQSSYELFLENCHAHVDRIVAHLTGDEGAHAGRSAAGVPDLPATTPEGRPRERTGLETIARLLPES